MSSSSETERGSVRLERTTIADRDAFALHEALYREADERGGMPAAAAVPAMPKGLGAPVGALLICRDGEVPVGLGGIRFLDTPIAEVKSMYVAPGYRGTGLGRRILAELERIALERGCRAVRLDSSTYLTEAVALYRSAGYREIADYNGNSSADVWFERALR